MASWAMRWSVRILTAGAVLIVASFGAGQAQEARSTASPGKALYEARCVTCHGATGAGDGPLAKGLKDKPSDWTAAGGGLTGLTDQQIFDATKRGGPAIGRSRAMPAYPSLSDVEIRDLVNYVKALKRGTAR
jgi:mono/diheme cytochrome c family protein